MPLNCGVEEDSWESLGLQGDSTSPSQRRSVLNIHWKDWCWSWNSNTLATWYEELTNWKRPWCWERLRTGGEGDERGWNGWMASPTWWTWVWASSGSWWWTGKPSMLQSMGLQRVGHDLSDWTDWLLPAGCGSDLTGDGVTTAHRTVDRSAGLPQPELVNSPWASRKQPFTLQVHCSQWVDARGEAGFWRWWEAWRVCRRITGDKLREEDRQGKWGCQCPGKPGVHDTPGGGGCGGTVDLWSQARLGRGHRGAHTVGPERGQISVRCHHISHFWPAVQLPEKTGEPLLFVLLFICLLFKIKKIFFNWRIIALQYCTSFCHTATWISHKYTYILSHLSLRSSLPITPPWSSQSTKPSSLFYIATPH